MTNDFQTTCDALMADLRANVDGLKEPAVDEANVHLYEPWTPEEFQADGYRHLAVWPVGEGQGQSEQSQDMFSDSVEMEQMFAVSIWESSGSESTRLLGDPDGAKALLDIYSDVRGRLMQRQQSFGGAFLTRLVQTTLPEHASRVRWFRVHVLARRFVPYT